MFSARLLSLVPAAPAPRVAGQGRADPSAVRVPAAALPAGGGLGRGEEKYMHHPGCHSNEQLLPASNFRAHPEGAAFLIPTACMGSPPCPLGGFKHPGAQKPACICQISPFS